MLFQSTRSLCLSVLQNKKLQQTIRNVAVSLSMSLRVAQDIFTSSCFICAVP